MSASWVSHWSKTRRWMTASEGCWFLPITGRRRACCWREPPTARSRLLLATRLAGVFLRTEDFDADYERFTAAGVRFLEAPRDEAYGKVAVFEDPFGNKWDLIQNRS